MARTAEPRPAPGLLAVLIATAVAGVSGYLIQLVAPRLLVEPGEYLSFSVFWSTLYLAGSAVGGIQQEVARAARPAVGVAGRATVRGFVGAAVLIALGVSVVGALCIAPQAFAGSVIGMAGALGIGLSGYVATAVLTGLLYGVHRLHAVAWLVAIDAMVRAVIVVACLAVGAPPDVVALAIALPFGLAAGAVWFAVRRRVSGAYDLDVPPKTLARNALHTVAAAAATGLMVTGMPLLFRVTLADASLASLAALTLLVTLTRAPFIIPLMALQSFLTVSYRDDPTRADARMWRYLGLAGLAAGAAGLAAWYVIPAVIDIVSGGAYRATPGMSVVVVVSAVLVGSLCISGPALLARGRHRIYAAGWLVAASVTVVLLTTLPFAPDVRAAWALLVAPASGLAVHLMAVRLGPGAGPEDSTPQRE